ncbi:hypothetical protein L3V82_07095 [Thiotrichales bacterium 19S3-7]|nr:hypothetical protein [Thiotrichales bacterium 19S3-7]MCF6801872.1 hypothetical protein [Thiotrichales bacterium 19S3-11]
MTEDPFFHITMVHYHNKIYQLNELQLGYNTYLLYCFDPKASYHRLLFSAHCDWHPKKDQFTRLSNTYHFMTQPNDMLTLKQIAATDQFITLDSFTTQSSQFSNYRIIPMDKMQAQATLPVLFKYMHNQPAKYISALIYCNDKASGQFNLKQLDEKLFPLFHVNEVDMITCRNFRDQNRMNPPQVFYPQTYLNSNRVFDSIDNEML